MAEYGSFGTTALKLDIGPEHSSLGPGLAYLYGTFGYTVGKLVGQYSDSGRVSHSLQSLSGKPENLKSRESREERGRSHSTSSEGEEIGSAPVSPCGS